MKIEFVGLARRWWDEKDTHGYQESVVLAEV